MNETNKSLKELLADKLGISPKRLDIALDAQAEIAKRDERIDSLTAAGAEYQRQCFEQAAEITRLKGVIGKCKEALEDSHQNINQERGFASEIKRDIEQALAAIKEIEHDTTN